GRLLHNELVAELVECADRVARTDSRPLCERGRPRRAEDVDEAAGELAQRLTHADRWRRDHPDRGRACPLPANREPACERRVSDAVPDAERIGGVAIAHTAAVE